MPDYSFDYICFVMKILFKYLIVVYVLLLGSNSMANTCSELNHTLNRNHTSNSYIQKSDRFIDTFLYANTKSENNENLLALVEKEVDDDETESHKTKITKKFHSVSIFNYRDATIAVSYTHLTLPTKRIV